MNLSDINTKISELTKADTTIAYPNANRLININIWNQKVVTAILDSQDSSDFNDANRAGYSTLTKALVSGQRDYNFGINEGVVKVKRVDISYDGVNSYLSTPVDSSSMEVGMIDNATDIDTYFSTSAPGHDWKYNSVFLYPQPTASTGSIQVEVSRTAKDFTLSDLTTGTAQPGFDNNFHMMVAYGASYEYFISNGMIDMAAEVKNLLAEFELRLRRQYGKKEENYPLRFQSDYVDYN